MTGRTERNLNVAMHGEAFAAAKFKRYAAFARSRGNAAIANLMARASDEDRMGHFAREIELAGLFSDDLGNLQDLLNEKRYAIERYTQYANEAQEDGDEAAARLFEALAKEDSRRLPELEKILNEQKSDR